MSEPDFRKMGDPMNDRLPPNAELRRIVKKIGLLHAERERLILKAHQEGASLREIAEILEVNHVTVRNALQKLSWRLANEKPPDDKEGSTGTG